MGPLDAFPQGGRRTLGEAGNEGRRAGDMIGPAAVEARAPPPLAVWVDERVPEEARTTRGVNVVEGRGWTIAGWVCVEPDEPGMIMG